MPSDAKWYEDKQRSLSGGVRKQRQEGMDAEVLVE